MIDSYNRAGKEGGGGLGAPGIRSLMNFFVPI